MYQMKGFFLLKISEKVWTKIKRWRILGYLSIYNETQQESDRFFNKFDMVINLFFRFIPLLGMWGILCI